MFVLLKVILIPGAAGQEATKSGVPLGGFLAGRRRRCRRSWSRISQEYLVSLVPANVKSHQSIFSSATKQF
jgi:hypothetical protein